MDTSKNNTDSHIIEKPIVDEMKQSFLSYAMSVIVSRAIPDVRDGLKPVHRRILFAMHDMGLASNKSFKKSARIVGEVLGKYHPHGDSAVYDAMVRMAQDFSLRYRLVHGQGNFGSIDGDSPAAMRYTEAKLTKQAEELLDDIGKNTVSFRLNFDESLQEPEVLPSRLPNLLINGSTGIAVGMATNMPPHNLVEIGNAVIAQIQNPQIELSELLQIVSGPDFPTGALAYGKSGLYSAYKTGHGKVLLRAKTHIEEVRSRQAIIVDEIPYQVNKANLIESIAQLVKDKIIEGIHDIRDESDRVGMRIVFELKKDANTEVLLNQLYKHSRLQTSYSINNLCLVDNVPRVLSLPELLQQFINHRFDIITKRTEFELDKAQKRAHILEGLKIALDNLDEAIRLIRAASSQVEAKESLMNAFELDDIQSQAILDMRLQKLTGLERQKILDELDSLKKLILELESILASSEKRYNIIIDETKEVIEKHGDERKTQMIDMEIDVDIEDLIEDEDVVVTITNSGYIKRIPLDTYKAQRRGGKGIIATTTKEEDFVEKVFVTHTKSYILFFTNLGQVHWLKVYKIPEGSRQARGRAIVNLLSLREGEKVNAAIPISTFEEGYSLLLATKRGTIKKTSLSSYAKPREGGIKAIKLIDDDELISAQLTDGSKEVIIASKQGLAVRFHEMHAREMGRVSQGVRGIRLAPNDEVIGMVVADNTKTLLTITENGYGKRTKIDEYRLTNRGGKGVINIQCSERNGLVVSIKVVDDETGLLFMSKKGITMRTRADQISVIGRNTQGVRLMKLSLEDCVVSCATIVITDDGIAE